MKILALILFLVLNCDAAADPYPESGLRSRMLYWEEVREKANTPGAAELELALILRTTPSEVKVRLLEAFIQKHEGSLAELQGQYQLTREQDLPLAERLEAYQQLALRAGGHPLKKALGYASPVEFRPFPGTSIAKQREFLSELYTSIMALHKQQGQVAAYLETARFHRIQLGEFQLHNDAVEALFPSYGGRGDEMPPRLRMLHPLPDEVSIDGSTLAFVVDDAGPAETSVRLSETRIEIDGADITSLLERRHDIDLSPDPVGPRESIEFRVRNLSLAPGLHQLFAKFEDEVGNIAIYNIEIPIYSKIEDPVLEESLREMSDSELIALLESRPVLAWSVTRNKFKQSVTLLNLVSGRGLENAAETLLKAGVPPMAAIPSRHGTWVDIQQNPLHTAARFGQLEVLKTLLAGGASLASADHRFLRVPARGKHYETVAYLLAQGVSPIGATPEGDTVLHEFSTDPELLKLFVPYFPNIDIEGHKGLTPVQLAASYGATNSVRFLLQAGANPKQVTATGATLLDLAGEDKAPEEMRVLLGPSHL